MTTRAAPLDATLRVAAICGPCPGAPGLLLHPAETIGVRYYSSSCLACAANGGDADATIKWETLSYRSACRELR